MHCHTQPEQIAALAELVQQLTEAVIRMDPIETT